MFLRRARTTLAAALYFSVEAAVMAKLTATGDSTTTAGNSDGRDTLGRRLLSLVYAKRSAVIAIQKWKEEGHVVCKYELNRLICELRKHKRYKHAQALLSGVAVPPSSNLPMDAIALLGISMVKTKGIFVRELTQNARIKVIRFISYDTVSFGR